MRTRFFAALFCILALAGTASARKIADATHGYTIDIPDDWKEIPGDLLNRDRSDPPVHFIAGYEPESHARPYTWPYVLIQHMPHPGGRTRATVTEQELRQLAASVTGIDSSRVKEDLSPTRKIVIDLASELTGFYTTSPPGVRTDGILNISSAGRNGPTIHGHSFGLVMRDAVVIMHAYTLASEDEANIPTFEAMMASFKPDSAHQVRFQGDPADHGPISPALGAAAVLGVVAIVAIIYAVSRRRRAY
jgi:hypothetical protein